MAAHIDGVVNIQLLKLPEALATCSFFFSNEIRELVRLLYTPHQPGLALPFPEECQYPCERKMLLVKPDVIKIAVLNKQ